MQMMNQAIEDAARFKDMMERMERQAEKLAEQMVTKKTKKSQKVHQAARGFEQRIARQRSERALHDAAKRAAKEKP